MIKKSTLFVTLLLVLAIFSGGMRTGHADNVRKTPSIAGNGEEGGNYDPYLYGNFLNTTYQSYKILPSGHTYERHKGSKHIDVSIDEKITISLFITPDSSFAPPFGEKNDLKDFYVKFLLLNKADWIPRKISGSGLDIELMGKSEVEIGRKNEEVIRFEDKWFKTLEKETQNIYDLRYDKVKYSEENATNKTFHRKEDSINFTGIETDVTLKIKQAGSWSLSTLIKPVGGNFWVLANGRNVTLKVKKPPSLLKKSLPILISGIMIGGSAVCTYSLKKRKKWFYKISKRFKN